MLNNKEYVITGSAACIFYGWPVENEDIDIFIHPFVLQNLIDNNVLVQDDLNQDRYFDTSKKIECFKKSICDNWTFKRAFNYSIIIKKYRIMSISGLYLFYSDLYNLMHKEKHKNKLNWLKYKI